MRAIESNTFLEQRKDITEIFLLAPILASKSKGVVLVDLHDRSSQQAMAEVAVAYMSFRVLAYSLLVVREPSVPERDRDGKLSESYLSQSIYPIQGAYIRQVREYPPPPPPSVPNIGHGVLARFPTYDSDCDSSLSSCSY